MLFQLETAQDSYVSNSKKAFIIAEGFERRSLYWIAKNKNKTHFDEVLICRYQPSKKSLYDELLDKIKLHTTREPIILDYNRFEPTIFEQNLKSYIKNLEKFDEIIIDISVMSKLLIMIILCTLKNYKGKITILYSEPVSWGPTEKTFKNTVKNRTYGTCIGLSSVGVGNVVRTPGLSSIIMQDCPILLVSFLSFNEQLINVLVNEISPTKCIFINQKYPRAKWRENAMRTIHRQLIEDYTNKDNANTILSYDFLDYKAVFEELANIYKTHCYNYRIVVAPTGCKIQTIACVLFKLCCPDVHIEYPTPESYLFDSYSSDKIHCVHEIRFENYNQAINDLGQVYSLNG